MNDMFTFEPTALELLVERTAPGSTLGVLRLLTAMEPEDEEAVEDAFEALAEKGVTVDISDLPADYGSGELEKRLRREEALVQSGRLLENLEDTDPLRLYLEELAGIPAQGDPDILVGELLAGDENAARKLVDLNLYRAVEAAKAMTGRGVLLLDLIQEASLGLWRGITCYESGDFDSHIDWWIGQSLARVIALQARERGVVQNMRKAVQDYQDADKRLLTQLGRNATLEEIAMELHITPEQTEMVEDALRSARAMEKVKAEPKQDEEEDQAVEDTAYFQSRQRIEEMLSVLSQQEAKVLTLRFGLEGGVPESPETVGTKLGLTADQVVAMEAAALAKLRQQ